MSARTLRTSAKQPEKPLWTGSGRRHAGISQEKENLRCVPGVPGAVAWRTEVLQAEFRVRKACRKKERPPVPFGKDTEGDRGTEFFGRHGFRTRISPARTTRAAWLIQRVHENHAARTMGSSDGGIISVQEILIWAGGATPPLQDLR